MNEQRLEHDSRPANANRTIGLLSLGHFTNDTYTGYLAPLLPLLVQKIGFSLTLAGVLVSIQAIASSLLQPVFGMLSDRLRRPLLVVIGPLLTALLLSAIGLAHSWTQVACLIVLGGLGTAAFHPQAASLTSRFSGGRKGLAMSVFVTAGSAGHAMGPIFILSVVTLFGLHYSWITAFWGAAVAFLLWRFLPSTLPAAVPSHASPHSNGRNGGKSLLIVIWFIVFLRAFVIDSFLAFNPLFLHQKQYSVMLAGAANTIFEISGSAGTLLGGPISDRFGRKSIILFSLLGSIPLFWLFLHTNGIPALIYLGLAGAILYSSVPVTIIMAQELFPHRSGAVSSLTMGFAWGMAGLLLTPFGAIAEKIGLGPALQGMVIILPVAFLLAVWLPNQKRKTA